MNSGGLALCGCSHRSVLQARSRLVDERSDDGAALVTDALVMAIWRRGKPDALLHHSDRGSQYGSEQFQKLLAGHGVICSMSHCGNVWSGPSELDGEAFDWGDRSPVYQYPQYWTL